MHFNPKNDYKMGYRYIREISVLRKMITYSQLTKEIKKQLSDFDKTLIQGKREEQQKLQFMYDDKHYRDLVYDTVSDDAIDRMNLKLVRVWTDEHKDLWLYFKVFTSTISYKNVDGFRRLKYLLLDVNTNKYLGILCISSDIQYLTPRDKYIGWDGDNRSAKLNNIMNISCCVGLRPSCHNYNIGKLLCSLAFSKEVYDEFLVTYGAKIAAYVTLGVNGKSVQYDRLKQIKFCGYTKGQCKVFTESLYEKCFEYLKSIGHDLKGVRGVIRREILTKEFELEKDIANELHPRSVYVGFTGKDAQAFLIGTKDDFTPELQTVDEIVAWWKDRWARQRYNHLKKIGNLMRDVELYRISSVKDRHNSASRMRYSMLKNTLGEKEFTNILKQKYLETKLSKRQQTVVTTTPETVPDTDPDQAPDSSGDTTSSTVEAPNGNYVRSLFHQSGVVVEKDGVKYVHLESKNEKPIEYLSRYYGVNMYAGGKKKRIYSIQVKHDDVKDILDIPADIDDDYVVSLIDNVAYLDISSTPMTFEGEEGEQTVDVPIGFKLVMNIDPTQIEKVKTYLTQGTIKNGRQLNITHKLVFPVLERVLSKSHNQDWLADVIKLASNMMDVKPSKCTLTDYRYRVTIIDRMV